MDVMTRLDLTALLLEAHERASKIHEETYADISKLIKRLAHGLEMAMYSDDKK